MAVSAAVTAFTIGSAGPWAAALAGVGSGVAIGFANGIVVAKLGVEPFIATLGMLITALGLAQAVCGGGGAVPISNGLFETALGQGSLAGIPVPVLAAILAISASGFIIRFTSLGRYLLAVGDNDEAAWLLGLNVGRIRIGVYALSGALAGLAGAIYAARVGVGQPTAGLGWELAAITAFVLGATSLGGRPAGAGSTLVGVCCSPSFSMPSTRRVDQLVLAMGPPRCDPHRRRGVAEPPRPQSRLRPFP